jgi:uncharacterized protein YfaS (alpha-2-macroglobulin family)
MRTRAIGLLSVAFLFFSALPGEVGASTFEETKTKAEAFFQEKSYAQARELYSGYDGELTETQQAWVRFRISDLSWRMALSSDQQDHTILNTQRGELLKMIQEWKGQEEKKSQLIDVYSSLGESYWGHGNEYNWHQAQQYYLEAIQLLSGMEYSEAYRLKFLEIIHQPLLYDSKRYYHSGALWPLEQAEHAVGLAKSPDEVAMTHFHLAKALQQQGIQNTPSGHERVRAAYVTAIEGGRKTEWYDDVLMSAGQFMEHYGTIKEVAAAQYQLLPSYKEALKLYRMILKEFKKEESRFYDQAQQRVDEITKKRADVHVHQAFTPDSLIQFGLNTRNLKSVDLTLTRIDLAEAYVADGITRTEYNQYSQHPFIREGEVVKRWSVALEPEFEHQQVNRSEKIDPLPAGAYWLETSQKSSNSGTLILVTEATVTAQEFHNKMLIFTCDAMTGKPRPGTVTLLRHIYSHSDKSRRIRTEVFASETGEDGTVILPIKPLPDNHSLQRQVLVATIGGHPAILQNSYGHYRHHSRHGHPGKVYVMTERPAYRPGQEVNFKLIYRAYEGEEYITTPGAKVESRVTGPRGEELYKKVLDINEFGSAHGNFEVPAAAALGEYHIHFRDLSVKNKPHIGQNLLFRLEEYKLPEFKVSVKMPEKDGKAKIFKLGELVQAEVLVEYYAGGAIADAEVEYDIHRTPLYGDNPWPEPYPWLYRNVRSSAPWMQYWQQHRGGRTHVTRAKAKTDSEGKAVIEFQTQPGQQDLEYIVEARVMDSSRRQVNGSGSVKVISKPFQIHVKPESRVYLPGDTAKLDVKALDANGNPVETGATLIVTRERWVEKKKIHRRTKEERVVFRGYDAVEVDRKTVRTDEEGTLRVTYKPEEEGFYRIKVVSPPVEDEDLEKGKAKDRVVGEATIFACTAETKSLGYRFGALQLIPDKATYQVGDMAKVIVIGPEEDMTALLTLSGKDLISHTVLSLEGNARLYEFQITDAGLPNIFINGLMIRDGRALVAAEEIVIPPLAHFLDVEVKASDEELKPGESGEIAIQVRDHAGEPIRAELALGVIDTSLYYIQQETSGDIRQFFFGDKNQQLGHPRSMLNERQLVTIKESDEEDWDEVVTEDVTKSPIHPYDQGGAGYYDDDLFAFEGARNERRSRMLGGGAMNTAAPSVGQTFSVVGRMSKAMSGLAVEESEVAMDAAMPLSSRERKKEMAGYGLDDSEGGDQNGRQGSVKVRSDFRESAFWNPELVTDENGYAKVTVEYPESLTEWTSRVRAQTTAAVFGQGEVATRTNLPVTIRFQSPRFLVEGDEVTLASVLMNQTSKAIRAKVKLDIEGLTTVTSGSGSTKVESGKQGRVEGVYKVPALDGEGQADITASVKSAGGSDAMQKSIPLVEYGIEKLEARSIVMEGVEGGAHSTLEWVLPKDRKVGASQLQIQLTPSLASTCLDALPYLAKYPYGCVEQTLSRFVPAAIVAKTLEDMGLDPAEVENRVFGGIEESTPTKVTGTKKDLKQLDEMVKAGIKRLKDFQHGDGGWGWWKDDKSNDFMTAYVVQGLMLGADAGVSEAKSMAQRGAQYLRGRIVQYEKETDMACWLVYAVSMAQPGRWPSPIEKAANEAYRRRDSLNAYTRALLALSYHSQSKHSKEARERAEVLVRNLENGLVEVKAESELIGQKGSATMPVTCHWGKDGIHYRWSNGGVEATAFALRALLKIDPENKRVDQAARWLINNRRGAQWKNTRDTAIVIYTLIDYMKVKKETAPDFDMELKLNGKSVKKEKFTSRNALGVVTLTLPESKLRAGKNQLDIRIKGEGRLYTSGWLTYFSKEKEIPAAGNEIYVKREYTLERAVETLIGEVKLKKMPLEPGQELKPGDRIHVRLVLEAKNNYEYLVIEDRKAAGLEAIQIQSGKPAYARKRLADGNFTGRQTQMYQELRDRHVAFFITYLDEGFHEINYMLRAETPGIFSALPATTEAMYVPEIKANSTSRQFLIRE